MSTLPLFKLPFLCINEILINMDIISLVSLSLVSRRCQRIVKLVKTKLTGFNIQIKESGIELLFVDSQRILGYWIFEPEKKENRGSGDMEMSFHANLIRSYHSEEDIQQSMKLGLDYLRDLFKKPINKFYLHPDGLPECPLQIELKECNELLVKGKKAMKDEYLKSILETIIVKTKCTLWIPINPTFECNTNLLKFKELKCVEYEGCGHWITRNVFLNLKCTHMQLYHSLLEADAVMSFFERWFHSDDTEFHVLVVQTDKLFDGLNFDRFQPKPWNPEQRSRHFL
ncbi:hypothetical protein CRE_07184 [Caenorhabditis remanei]|uniref:F-box domain-containing protein n=1 Tax=Caenorhabditis remanei TaxID=31234 RepID=E3NUV5_CAERE|nr:hypothetical protein CRE_07184 [Caenorhabditis remanei]